MTLSKSQQDDLKNVYVRLIQIKKVEFYIKIKRTFAPPKKELNDIY